MAKSILDEDRGAGSVVEVQDDSPVELKIAYIGGGSRGWAHSLMNDLANCPFMGGEVRLYDIDHEASAFNARWGNWLQTHPEARSKWRYRSVKTMKTALKDADFVFLSILPGRIEDMKVDLLEPEKYGIFHSTGDTVGPAGINRALRTIPSYRQFAEAIAQYAPGAWVINFTNPMTVCTRTLYEIFPAVKAFGCCHEVFGSQRALADLYADTTGNPRPTRAEVRVNVLGINHFTWVDKAECHGEDLLAMLAEHIRKPGVMKPEPKRKLQAMDQPWRANKRLVAHTLFQRFGVLAAAGDRHLAEFVPWYLTSRESCAHWNFGLVPYSHRLAEWTEKPKALKKTFASQKLPDLKRSGEEYINQMLALLGKTSFRTNVNMPNHGQMGNTPEGAVVETNAFFSENAVQPVVSGALPDPVNALVQRHVSNQEMLVKAVLTKDKDLAFAAFLSDPLVTIPLDKAYELFETMSAKTGVTW